MNRKLLKIPLECFADICLENEDLNNLFTKDAKKKIRAIAKSNSVITAFLNDFTKDGLKRFLMSAGRETILLVISLLPFGGTAKIAFELLSGVLKGA